MCNWNNNATRCRFLLKSLWCVTHSPKNHCKIFDADCIFYIKQFWLRNWNYSDGCTCTLFIAADLNHKWNKSRLIFIVFVRKMFQSYKGKYKIISYRCPESGNLNFLIFCNMRLKCFFLITRAEIRLIVIYLR